jgi:hypothetical protein
MPMQTIPNQVEAKAGGLAIIAFATVVRGYQRLAVIWLHFHRFFCEPASSRASYP